MGPGPASAGAASTQLERYLTDERLARQFPEVRFSGLAVVFHGWEMVFCDAVLYPRRTRRVSPSSPVAGRPAP